jgi:thiamine-phosphate pyrophosphorylase
LRAVPSPLYVICDAEACDRAGRTLADFAAACIDGGATFLQVRAKGASSSWLLEATTAVVRRAQGAGTLVVVNDRADVARLAGAGGVHVGQTDLSPAAVRAVVGPAAFVGRSTHTPDQYEAAFGEPVDYVAIGPVFTTATKATGRDAVGLEGVRRAAARTAARGLPLVAIGGITLERARSVRDAGAQSIAVISDLLATGDPAGRVREFLRALEP